MLRRRVVSSIAICVLLPLALVACGEKTPSDPRVEAPLVRTATLQGAISGSRSFTGTVAARVQSDLGFRVSGKVLERFVDAGQAVKHGQLLMRIDTADLKLAVHAQQEAVAAARALAKQTAADEARYRDLLGTGVISASTYDQAKAAADAAKAQLNAAAAQAEVARNASRYAELVPMPTALSWKRWPSPAKSSAQDRLWCAWLAPVRARPSSSCLRRCARR
jgi:multidrug efflux pump subunit AcrA (membrane-fusion protein)